MQEFKLRLQNFSQIVQVCASNERLKKGAAAMNDICILVNATIVVALDGKIYAVAEEADLLNQAWYREAKFQISLDMSGKSVVPGLVDGHTHPVSFALII